MNIISRQDAIKLGLSRYYTGRPCNHGHDSERYVSQWKCVECKVADGEQWRAADPEKVKANKSAGYRRNKTKHRATADKWKDANREKVRVDMKAWKQKNREKVNADARYKYNNDPNAKCNALVRCMLRRALKATKQNKQHRTTKVLGYSPQDFKEHIEQQFIEGMSWINHGEWHVDHIVPLSVMIDRGITNPKMLNALSNLQPLWAADNLVKGAKLKLVKG